jgi:hypothetical protein
VLYVVSSGELLDSHPVHVTRQVRLERIEELLETLVTSFSEAVGEAAPDAAGPAVAGTEEEEEEEEEGEEEEEEEDEGGTEEAPADSKKAGAQQNGH